MRLDHDFMGGLMAIKYKLHHVGLLCTDTGQSARYYQAVLGHELTARFYNAGQYDLTFLASGSKLLIELIGQPFGGAERDFFEARGPGLHHLAFAVDDVDAAFAGLTATGIRIAWEPQNFLFVRHCGVYDDNGVVIEVLQELEPLARPRIQTGPGRPQKIDFLLHHFDIFSNNWQRTRQFYTDHFGLRSVFEYIFKDGGAFIYLADSFFDADTRQALVEVIGPPHVETREFIFAKKFGSGMDHIGYVVNDVAAAYQLALTRGAANLQEPYLDYGTEMGWLKDPDGNDLELMRPVPKEQLRQAFRTGKPYRPAARGS